MRIHVYSIMRNEEDLLPYFLRHYETFADKIFIYDDHSTDQTVEIARSHSKVRLLKFKYPGGLNELDHSRCFEEGYVEHSRGVADWVLCVDGDEFIYHRDILKLLKTQKDLNRKVLKVTAYTIYSKDFPTTDGQIYEECYMGQRTPHFDKQIIFDPSINITFGMGRHKSTLPERVKFYRCGLVMLHFRYISKGLTLKRLATPRHMMPDEKLEWKRRVALDRYEQGINGELVKVI